MAYSQLQCAGFFSSDFSNFHIKEIGNLIIDNHSRFAPLIEVFEQIKLTPLRVLKIQLLIQNLLQINFETKEKENLVRFILKLGLKIKKMVESQATYEIQQYTEPDQRICSSKYLVSKSGVVCQNGKSLILRKIVQPLFQLQKRLIFSYELISSSFENPELELSECWAMVNLLKRFLQFSPQIQAIGRYYSDKYAAPMIFLIKVLDVDIQLLYKRIKTFADGKICQYRSLLEQGFLKKNCDDQRIRIHQFLQFIEEVQSINESIKLLYLSIPFKVDLFNNNIHMPSLFTVESNLDLLYLLKKATSREQTKIWNTIAKHTKIRHCKSLGAFL